MSWETLRLEVVGSCLTVLADAILLAAGIGELKEDKDDQPKTEGINPAWIDFAGSFMVLIADTLLAIAILQEAAAKLRGDDPPNTDGLTSWGNWGCFIGDGLAIVAAQG